MCSNNQQPHEMRVCVRTLDKICGVLTKKCKKEKARSTFEGSRTTNDANRRESEAFRVLLKS